MFAVVRSLRRLHGLKPRPAGGRPHRRRHLADPIRRFGTPLVALGGIAGVAVAAWVLAGGASSVWPFTVDSAAAVVVNPAGGIPFHLDSVPTGADVLIDGNRRGQTPLVASLVPGPHAVTLRHPDTVEVTQTMDVSDSGASFVIRLWRQRPSVLPLGAVYPGATLTDARFLADGQVALVIGLPVTPAGATDTLPMHEVWRLDPSTGQLAPVTLAGVHVRASVVALAPDGQQVAYVTADSSPSASSSLSPSGGPPPAPLRQDPHRDTVWIAPLDGSRAPRSVREVDAPVNQGFGTDAERIVDLVWTPDSTRLVAISRQGGAPTRTRLSLVNVGAEDESGTDVQIAQLVVLPADIAPGAAVADPSGQWLALMAHAAVALGGGDVFTLCTVELRPGGTFRELANLGSAQRGPIVPALAWAPDRQSGSAGRLAFVAPVPADASSGSGVFDLFGAFRASSLPSGLFLADLQAMGLDASQPRRLGTMTNVLASVWPSDDALFGFVRQDDGALGLRSIDPATALVRDVGVRLPAGVGQGTGLSAHWDVDDGRVLLLSRPSSSTIDSGTALGSAFRAWLVSFAAASDAAQR